MDRNQFRASAPGRLLEIEDTVAFVPDPVAPSFALSPKQAKLLEEAQHLIGTLNGTGRSLVDPGLLIQPFVRREAVLSSKIEGTIASYQDLVLFEADPTSNQKDAREVYNYVLALNEAIEKAATIPVSRRLISETHRRLMEGATRDGYAYPGSIRETQVYIGTRGLGVKRARFVPPPPAMIPDLLSGFDTLINGEDDLPLLVKLAFAHYQFETIHPFVDGNGRIGRLLITLLLCVHKRLSTPLLYLSAYLCAHKDEYYDRLLAVSTHGAWGEWLEFFLNGIIETASDAIERSRQLLDLHSAYRQQLIGKKCGDTAQRILDTLFESPAYTIPNTATALKSTYPTVQKATDKLIEQNIVRLIPNTNYPKIYLAQRIVEIIEDTTLMSVRDTR